MTQFWEGENMTVDSRRKLAFMSRTRARKGIITIDVKDPWNPQIIGFQKTSQGHTATCLNDCRFIWRSAAASLREPQLPSRSSAVSVTDVRDLEHPSPTRACSRPTSVARAPTSGSTHSVDVDFDGVAWVSGSGGARGWWTEGLHKDTVTGQDALRDAV